ncbi:class II aldolase/adducin family protein [Puniceicoccus vermicola]|uniref:Class II aldolase/adducin family protein n=1 Tax=Puniceicoccus vermicola TaxID=388746 RepID=A0A7X1E5X6_9BACT|nr:class II aldolase/adducin family protein [Puniceicoccus vermicola]MBC2603528.1 class II aldolase/adducin family protein [Puniceicoccus vermicola]
MKKLLTQKDVEEMVASGACPDQIASSGEILTPGARDFLRTASRGGGVRKAASTPSASAASVPAEPIVPDYEYHWTAGKDPKTPQEIQAFFTSAPVEKLKKQICDMGRRMWEKGYTDGNGGNLTIRVGDNMVLCTPTLVSKGFLTPEQICLVDMNGDQLAGKYKRTSEVNTHIGIMKRQPQAKACCHAHPPHATAYAVAKVVPPTCLIPEAEVFLGAIGTASYQTPGSPENAKVVGEVAVDHQAVLMENHGVITWGKDIEDAYWKMENTDAYCQTILLASMLGKELKPISGKQAKDLIGIRKQLGMSDFRENWEECELCDNTEFRPGFHAAPEKESCSCQLGAGSADGGPVLNEDAEQVVKVISERILQTLEKK